MRILIAIAHHGTKNRVYLDRMLDAIRGMSFEVHVVILSEAEKDLPADVEIRVGLPSKDPWSLPFAHRALFDERQDDYDLFVYSEDDTLIEERHLRTFLDLCSLLPEDHLPGSLRFELHPDGSPSYCSIHSHYRFDPTSVQRFGEIDVVRFSNDHAAWYAITQDQLKRAIRSGGFLVAPHRGWYDMLVSAATDIFTRCGFTRVLCLDRIDDLLVHHMPNVYLDRFGIDDASFRTQMETLKRIARHELQPRQILDPVTRLDSSWNRHSYPGRPAAIAQMVPERGSRVLTIGASSGDPELALVAAGADVTCLPVDTVLAEVQRLRGLSVLEPDLEVLSDPAWREHFDLVLLLDVLPYLPNPVHALDLIRPALARDGQALITCPDHRRYVWREHLSPSGRRAPIPRSFARDGIHHVDPPSLRRWVELAGFSINRLEHRSATRGDPFGLGGWAGAIKGNSLAVWAHLRAN